MMESAVTNYLAALQADPSVLGVLLFGSWARGNPRPGSDIDLLVIVQAGFRRAVERRDGRTFEVIFTTEDAAVAYWRSAPDDAVELWRTAQVLFDRDGTMERLRQAGRAIREQGKPPLDPEQAAHAQFDIHDQLQAAEALAAHDPLTARMIVSMKVVQLSELYFDVRQRWTPPPKQRLAALRELDPEAFGLIAAAYEEASPAAQVAAARALLALVFSR